MALNRKSVKRIQLPIDKRQQPQDGTDRQYLTFGDDAAHHG